MKKSNYNIEILSEKDFKDRINTILKDENSKHLLDNLINDLNSDLHLNYKSDIIIKSNFTVRYLRRIYFRWPKISNKYLNRFINLLRRMM